MSLCKKMTNVCNNFIKNEVNCSVDPIMGAVNPLNMNRADSSIVDNTVKFAIPLACDPYNTAKINCQTKDEFYLSKNAMWPSFHGSRDESKTDVSHSMSSIRHINIDSKQEVSVGSTEQTALDHAVQKSNALFENTTYSGNRTLVHGGRLQFFKDGKFILELARAQGEKPGWVSVPRKTFWPPSVHSFPATTNKNESSTSLSFSDDNSSIQSSPWQRDHCWKQSAPHQNVSKKMNMYFRRNKNFTLSFDGCTIAKKIRRRPHDTTVCALPCKLIFGGENDTSRRYFEANSAENAKESKTLKQKIRPRLKVILQRLLDKVPVRLLLLSKTTPGIFNNFATSPIRFSTLQYTHHHLSPRKRILEELGTVSQVVSEDIKTKKKCQKSSGSVNFQSVSTIGLKSQQNKSSSISIYSSTSSVSLNNRNCVNTTLNGMRAISPPTLARYSNHSIHSLLGNSDTCNQFKDDIHEKRSAELNDILRLKMMLSSSNSSNHKVLPIGQHATCLKKRSSAYTVLNHHNPGCTSFIDLLSSNSKPEKSSEKALNPERSAHRCKGSINSSPPLSGFHPYLSSAKYAPTNVAIAENYLHKDGCEISFIHSKHVKSPSKSVSSLLPEFSNSIQNENVFQFSQPSNVSSSVTGKDCSNTKFSLTNGVLNPNSVNSLEAISNISANHIGQVVPQLNSDEEITTNSYKHANDQKNKKEVEGQLCSESFAYHIPFDMENKHLHNSSPVSTSTLYCFYPPQGSPNSNHQPSSYLRPVTYYPSHYGSFTTLRNQIWMHYPSGTLPSMSTHKESSVLAYNEDNISSGRSVQRITLPSSYSFQPVCSDIPWAAQNQCGILPGSSLSMNVKEDTNSVLNHHNPGCTSFIDLLSSNSKPEKSSEKALNPERSAHRCKGSINSSPPLSGFHPYLSSAKYAPTNVAIAENYLHKDGCEISFIHSKHVKSPSKSVSSLLPEFSNSIQNENVFQFSQPSNVSSSVTGKDCSNTKFSLTNGVLNPNSVNSLEAISNISANHIGQVVPQLNSDEEITTNSYKHANDQKNKKEVEGQLCSESFAYHIPFDMENKHLHNSSPVSTSTLYCFYPPQGSPNSNHQPSSYLRPVTYYPSHYGSFTTLRNQIWMHYPSGTLPSMSTHKESSVLAYNEDNISSGRSVQRITLPSSYSFQPVCSDIPWAAQNQCGILPGSSLSMNVKEDTNSDIPLNLSKH